MKQLLSRALLACASLAAAFTAAEAQTAVSYSDGDLLLGFRATGGTGVTKDYVVNIGQASQFTAGGSAFTVGNLGSIKADLDATFGTDWSSRPSPDAVYWSIAGTTGSFNAVGGDPAKTVYATRTQATPGTINPVNLRWTRQSSSTQGTVTNKVNGYAQAYAFTAGVPNTSTANSSKAIIQTTTDTNSYASYMPGGTTANSGPAPGISFAQYTPTIEGNFGNGTAQSILELYRMSPAAGATGVSTGTPGDLLGTFQLDDNAVLTFMPAQPSISLSSAAYSVNETAGTVTITATRTGVLTGAASVTVTPTDGSAVAGTDYTSGAQTINFAAGQVQASTTIAITNRPGTAQGDKTFTVTLSNPSGAQLDLLVSATVTIIDNDATFSLSSSTYTVSEDVASGVVPVTIKRVGNKTTSMSVNFSTVDDTALAGTDYTGQTNTTVTFAANVTQQIVNVAITNRTGFQTSRSFSVQLSSPTGGATLGTPNTATVTINDSANAGQIAFTSDAQTVQPVDTMGNPTGVIVAISRTNGATGTATVDVSVTGGTLQSGTDFTALANPTTVTFANGETSKAVTIQLKTLAPTTTGTIILGLSNVTSATLGATTSTTITVLTKDVKSPTLVLTAPKAGMLASGTTTFDVTGTASDDRGIDHIEVSINGVITNVTPGAFANGSAPFALSGVAAENGTNTISVVAVDLNGNRSAAQKRVVLYTNNRPALVGVYTGLLTPSAGAASNNTSGQVSVTVKLNGLFTGKVNLGAFTLPISGIVANNGDLHFKPSYGASLALVGPGKTPTPLGLLSATVAGDKLNGTLKTADNTGTLATLDGDRAFYDGKVNLLDADYLNVKGKSGFYTVVLPSQEQNPAVAHSLYPQGDGVATLTLTAKGIVTLKGTLADGSAVSATAPLSQGLNAPLYAKLYNKLGSIAGVAKFDKTKTDTDITSTGLLWIRPAVAGPYYAAGWPAGIQAGLAGTRYAVPVGASVLPNLTATGTANGNADLVFSDGKLAASVTDHVDIDAANKVTVLPAGTKDFSLKITAPKGAIAGTFLHSDTTKPAFKGVILQKGLNSAGFGYFLSVVPKGGSGGESGGVSLKAK